MELDQFRPIADQIETYIEKHFYDAQGVLMSYVDARTHAPFDRALFTPDIVPRRAERDPWAYWTYEDTIQSIGAYMDGLTRKFLLTGDENAIKIARKLWQVLRNTYYASQAFGAGSFLRPYGGYEHIHDWVEPLGTDQASTMFAGVYQFMKTLDAEGRAEAEEILLQTITWYERQGFRYMYYKFFIHEWNPGYQHAGSFYLPGIAFAAKLTGDPRWQRHLQKYFARLERGPVAIDDSYKIHNLYRTLYWGSDIPVLLDALGGRFGEFITPGMIENAYRLALADLEKHYDEPGTIKRYHAESKNPGFKPYVADWYRRDQGMGFAYYGCVHQGRSRPRLEMHALVGLASTGHEGARKKAIELMKLRSRVPQDFTDFLLEDHEVLPREVRHFAISVGAIAMEWYRNYWILKGLEK